MSAFVCFLAILLIKDAIDYRSTFFISIEHKAYEHNCREDEEIVECLDLICVERGEDHKQTRCDGQSGEDESLDRVEVLTLYHHADKDRDIHSVEGDDGQLVILKGNEGGELSADKTELPLEHPYCGDNVTDHGGENGHIPLIVELYELFGSGALISYCE